MFIHRQIPDLQPTPHRAEDVQDHRAEDAQRHRLLLNEMIDIGADLIRMAHRGEQSRTQTGVAAELANAAPESLAEAVTESDSEVSIAYERIFRAIRRGMLLVQKLGEPLSDEVGQATQRRTAARRRILREVEDTIQREVSGAEAEILQSELLDRLDDPDLDDDIDVRDAAAIIADIRRDLGLEARPGTHPWKRRTPDDLTELSAHAARKRLSKPRQARSSTAVPASAFGIPPIPDNLARNDPIDLARNDPMPGDPEPNDPEPDDPDSDDPAWEEAARALLPRTDRFRSG